ncbi:MAG TPA: hypothetical protein VGK73_22810, partial [Polyangiaceae bacterium]
SDEYEPEWETNGAFTSTLIMQGIPAVIKHGPDIRVFVRSGAQLKKINVSANGSTTGWTQNGTCTNVKSSPSLGSEGGTQTPYFACSAPGGGTSLCKQVSNSGCTLLGGTLKSAPTVVSSIIKDVVFYKGGDGDVWMYTTANGHQDLGLPLP